jgi:hypothetical protein
MRCELTAARLWELLFYNPATGIFFWLVSRGRVRAGSPAGCIDPRGRNKITIAGRKYLASRLASLYMRGRWPRGEIDHRDLNPGNDAWDNLRDSTRQQNQANTRARNKIGVKGVFRNGKGFRALITVDGQRHNFGTYRTISEAAEAYRAKAEAVFGQFARQ